MHSLSQELWHAWVVKNACPGDTLLKTALNVRVIDGLQPPSSYATPGKCAVACGRWGSAALGVTLLVA